MGGGAESGEIPFKEALLNDLVEEMALQPAVGHCVLP